MLQAQGGTKAGIKAPVPCSTFSCINTARGRERYWIPWDPPEHNQERLPSFEHQWEKGTKNKTRAAQGRFPPPSFSWATAPRTQMCPYSVSPSNRSSASSRRQPKKSMVHEHLGDCANAHSWRKQRACGANGKLSSLQSSLSYLLWQPLQFW